MKRRIVASAAALALAAVAGCASTGLSSREVPGRSQSSYLYSLYAEMPDEARTAPPAQLRLPASVAVVQVGEAAPAAPLLDTVRGEPGVFARVESLPGIAYEGEVGPRTPGGNQGLVDARNHVNALRTLASDMGMNYLLLVGGTVDYDTNGTRLSVMDLTIVGAFLVPSQTTRATARANGALIDVATGRVVVNSAAEARRDSLVPRASVDAEQVKLLTKLRDDVLQKLGQRVLEDVRVRAAAAGPTAAAAARLPAPVQPAPAESGDALPAAERLPGDKIEPLGPAPRAQRYETVPQ